MATARTNNKTFKVSVGLGDFPYSDVQAQTGVTQHPTFADMNNSGHLDFTTGAVGTRRVAPMPAATPPWRRFVDPAARLGDVDREELPSGGVSRYCGYLLVREAERAFAFVSGVEHAPCFPRRRSQALPVLVVALLYGDVWTGAAFSIRRRPRERFHSRLMQ